MWWHKWALVAVLTAAWLPLLQFLFACPSKHDIGNALLRTQMQRWDSSHGSRATEMRQVNPEWDFMARTFTVLALANRALALPDEAPERARAVATIDRIVASTLTLDAERGAAHFTLPYLQQGRFHNQGQRSLFIDGEILMMLAARDLVAANDSHLPEMKRRAQLIRAQMEAAPLLSGESYPDECWTFCNTTALAALRLFDAARHRDHSELASQWVEVAKRRLVEPSTGLLVSSFRYDGSWLDGPEGSSLWMSAHNLRLIDRDFANDQYHRARAQLAIQLLGFGFAREWPQALPGHLDVDSGPVVPLLDASAGSSGLALLAAASFNDQQYAQGLHRALQLAAFPIERNGGISFAAAGEMGDAVAAYATTEGALWELARKKLQERATVQ